MTGENDTDQGFPTAGKKEAKSISTPFTTTTWIPLHIFFTVYPDTQLKLRHVRIAF